MAEKVKKVWVVGHKNPDTDSICAAIAYANLKNAKASAQVVYEAKRAGEINEETKYVLRLIPLGGFVNMEGEEERSEEEGSFSKASIPKRIAIVLAGGLVNIIFGLLAYFIIIASYTDIANAIEALKFFGISMIDSLKMLVNGTAFREEQLTGIVGISEMVVETKGIVNYIYLIAVISVSLGVTNLLPIPPLDGGKVVLLLLEAIRKKPLKENIEIQIQMAGFALMIALTIFVTYKDIIRLN